MPSATAFRGRSAAALERCGKFAERASLCREKVKSSRDGRPSCPYQPFWRQFALIAPARRIATLIRSLENCRFSSKPQHFRGHVLLVRLSALMGGCGVQPI